MSNLVKIGLKEFTGPFTHTAQRTTHISCVFYQYVLLCKILLHQWYWSNYEEHQWSHLVYRQGLVIWPHKSKMQPDNKERTVQSLPAWQNKHWHDVSAMHWYQWFIVTIAQRPFIWMYENRKRLYICFAHFETFDPLLNTTFKDICRIYFRPNSVRIVT